MPSQRIYKGSGLLSAGTLSLTTSYVVTRTMFGREYVRTLEKGLAPLQGSEFEEITIQLPSLELQQIYQLEAAESVVLTLKGGSELPIEVDGNEATMRGKAKWSDDEEYEER